MHFSGVVRVLEHIQMLGIAAARTLGSPGPCRQRKGAPARSWGLRVNQQEPRSDPIVKLVLLFKLNKFS